MPRMLVIGNSENRRTHLLAAAAKKTGWQFDHFSYLSLLSDFDAAISRLQRRADKADVVRLDSPAENSDVERYLLAQGAATAEQEGREVIDPTAALAITIEHGQIVAPRQYYLGYRALLTQLESALEGAPWMNHPRDVLAMFDKPTTVQRLVAADIAVPCTLGVVTDFVQLEARMRERQLSRVFVKIANGSSASGVAAIHHDDESTWAITSVETEVQPNGDVRFYNSLKLQRYSGRHEVEALVNALAGERLLAEQWIPKAIEETKDSSGSGDVFDLRIVVIAGQGTHTVVRASKSPMTNLHLGNRRGDYEALRTRLGPQRCEALDELCHQVADAFSESHYFGLDVMFSRDLDSMYVLEVNAYGDLLPNVLDAQNLTTHERELVEWSSK